MGTIEGLRQGLYGVMDDFDQFVAGNLEPLLRTAHLITWDVGEAEDLVQECLFKVARRWPRVRRMEQPAGIRAADPDQPGGRRRQRPCPPPQRARRSSRGRRWNRLGICLIGLETRDELLDALAQLTPRQRAVLVLRYFNDLTEAQVAEVLGCSPGTVKSNASRGLARLREVLSPIPNPTREL